MRADVIVSMLAQHMDDGALPAEELSRTMTHTMEQASAALPGLAFLLRG